VLADTARVVPVPRLRTGSGAASRLLQDTAKDRAFNQKSHTTQQRYYIEGEVLVAGEEAQQHTT